ncbi:MAG: cyclodeaminase/cyclohydrolase family protein [Planctomycetota bacterium]
MAEETQNKLLERSVHEFAEAVAAKKPTPGGGSVAGAVGMLAVALGEMSLNFTRGKKKYAAHKPMHEHLASRFQRARTMYEQLTYDDIEAYGLYSAARKVEDADEKAQAMSTALAAAIDVPREVAKLSLAVLEDLRRLADACNRFLLSDLMAAAALASTVVRLADYNVQVNAQQVGDPAQADELLASSGADVRRAELMLATIEDKCGRIISG